MFSATSFRGLYLRVSCVLCGGMSRRDFCRLRQPHFRHSDPVQRIDAHAASFDVDCVAHAGTAAEAAEHEAANRRERLLVDMQPELLVDVADEREPVDPGGAVR